MGQLEVLPGEESILEHRIVTEDQETTEVELAHDHETERLDGITRPQLPIPVQVDPGVRTRCCDDLAVLVLAQKSPTPVDGELGQASSEWVLLE